MLDRHRLDAITPRQPGLVVVEGITRSEQGAARPRACVDGRHDEHLSAKPAFPSSNPLLSYAHAGELRLKGADEAPVSTVASANRERCSVADGKHAPLASSRLGMASIDFRA
ncbi:hypothetical protein RJ55_02255 [Drechmeria coniospora]|nr:hypothetical protein RJ55_02255 [Drechmeria coniospora]